VEDVVRFTVVLPGGDQFSGALEAQLTQLKGYEVVAAKNFWHEGNRFYGLNLTVNAPYDSQHIEIQFTTEAGYQAAKETHDLYRTSRDTSNPIEIRVHALLNIMKINNQHKLREQIPVIARYPETKLTTFAQWTLKKPRDWARYCNWLKANNRTFASIVSEFGLDLRELLPGIAEI
jgi:hypothetical protein